LAAMGGADAWKDIQVVHNTAVNHHPQARLPYIQEYWYFTQAPKHIVKIKNHDMNRMRAYTQEGGWSYYQGQVHPFNEERLENEIQSWHRSLYQKLHLLAKQSPRLRLKIGVENRLEFFDQDQFIGWLIVGDDGAPARHGGTSSMDAYTDFSALAKFDNVSWPSRGQDDSGWRFEILSFQVLDHAPDISMEPPIN
ncbi:MAG: hypothetical protein AAF512_25880, partial [Pseudomonadota bacterium]